MTNEYKLSYTAAEIEERLRMAGDSVLCAAQDLTPEQQAQVRENISVASQDEVNAIDDRVEAVEYHNVLTDLAYEHKELPDGEKRVTVYGDSIFGSNCYACVGEDLIPRKTFNRKFPYNGITITRNDMTYHVEGTTTAAAEILFTQTPNVSATPINSALAGKKIKIITFSNTVTGIGTTLSIQFRDADLNIVKIIGSNGAAKNSEGAYIGRSALMHSATLTVPNGAAFCTVTISIPANVEVNFDFQAYIIEDELTLPVSVAEPTLIGNASNDIITFPYQSTVTVKAPIAEYVKYMARNAKGDKATYIMPESFGAVGDGYADDSEAIALCLAAALETKQTVLMAKKYCITSPIVLSNDGLNIIANYIVYTGTDAAIKISGQSNTFKAHSIESSGIGVYYRADNNKIVCYNDIEVNSIKSASHGIVFYNGLQGICSNTIRFSHISAGGSGTYGICTLDAEGDSWVTENNFYGGHVSDCEWAVYRISGNSKLYGIQVENNVQGGFYIAGYVVIFYPRSAESLRDGSFPFFKFIESKYTHIYTASPIAMNEIDLSECNEIMTNASGSQHPLTEGFFGTIHGLVSTRTPAVGENAEVGVIYSDKTYIWGKRLIMTPTVAYKKVVTTETLDTRLIGRTDETLEEIKSLSQLPTKFIINNTNTEIYLHASYCAFGINKFEVVQANGFTCKIYDYDQNLVFDGAEQGDGIYKIAIYKDASLTEQQYGVMWIDNLYQCWEVSKVSGGSVENAITYAEQTLTEEQKEQARANIGAVSESFGAEKANRLMATNTAGDMLPVQIDEAFLIETTQVTGVPPEINLYDAETMAVSGAWYVLNTDNTMRLQQNANTGSYTAVAIPLHGANSVTLQYHEDSKYAQIYRWFLADDEGNCIQSSAAAVNTLLNVPLTIPVPANADSLYISGKGNWVESKVMVNAGEEASPYVEYTGIPEAGSVTIFKRKNDIELSLPKRYELVVGDTFELFWRGILKALDPEQYYIEAVCDRGKPYKKRFIYTPTAADAGEHILAINVYDQMHTLLASGKTVLSVNVKGTTPASDTVVLYVGDSLANSGQVPDEFHRRLTATGGTPTGDGLGNISFIGTCVSSRNAIPYEGYGGWTFGSYNGENKSAAFMWITATSHAKTVDDQHSVYADSNGTQWKIETIEPDRLKMIRTSGSGTLPASGTLTWVSGGSNTTAITYTASEQAAGNPFWDAASGAVNFAKYAQAQGKTGIDYVYVLLGWNALNAKDEEITAAVRTFISNVHASFPSCKVVLLGLQMPAHDGLAHNYGASETWTYYNAMSHVVRLNRLYQQIAEENTLVSFVQVSGQFDSAHNMPVLERTVNVRSTQKESYQSNGVHPMANGYYQIADACYRDFVSKLQN